MSLDATTTYGKEHRAFKHTKLLTHGGKTISFAQHENGQYFYTVLDQNQQDSATQGWLPNPVPVTFPRELNKVGYGVGGPYKLPLVCANDQVLSAREDQGLGVADPYLSTTARFSAIADFQVVSDNKHIYLFRQALEATNQKALAVNASGLVSLDQGRSSLKFNGTDTYLDLGALNLPLSGGFTFEVWCKFDEFLDWSRIFDFGNGQDMHNLILGLHYNKPEINFIIHEPGQRQAHFVPMEVFTWVHVALTVDENGEAIFYKNGNEVGRSKLIVPTEIVREKCYLGKSNWYWDKLFAGEMRDFRAWGKVRTPAEIKANMHLRLTGQEDNLEIYLPLDEGTGNHTADLARGQNIAILGEVKWSPNTFNQAGLAHKVVPFIDGSILVDRFILSGNTLKPVTEVRYRRSGHKTIPSSSKDSLGTMDMNDNKFYEPTSELSFIGSVHQGAFAVSLLPTEVQDIQRWQIFARTLSSGRIDAFNIERGRDGLFNAMGTLLYTSPDSKFQASVLERGPGRCPFTKRSLVPILDERKTGVIALQFNTSADAVALPSARTLSLTRNSFTIETWIKVADANVKHAIFGTLDVHHHENLSFNISQNLVEIRMGATHLIGSRSLVNNRWHHVAFSYRADEQALSIFVDGVLDVVKEQVSPFVGVGNLFIGRSGAQNNAASPRLDLQGAVEEFRIWDFAVDAEILAERRNFRLIGNEPGLTAYYRFDEGTGTVINDQSVNVNHGKIEGSPAWVLSEAPIGDHPGIQHRSFGFANRTPGNGLSSALYFQQEKQLTANSQNEPKPVLQNARLLLVANTEGYEPFEVPILEGLKAELTGDNFQENQPWIDYSGFGNNATISKPGASPTQQLIFNHNNQHFKAVRFRPGQGLNLAEKINLGSPDFDQYTIMVVDRYFSATNHGRGLQSCDTNWFLGKWAGKDNFYNADGHAAKIVPSVVGEFCLNTLVVDATSERWYLNGGEGADRRKTGISPGRLAIGESGVHGEEVSELDVAGIYIWDRALTDDERKTVEAWLGHKYGLTIAHETNLLPTDRNYLATLDFGINRQGKLVEIQDTVGLPLLRTPSFRGETRQQTWDRVNELESRIPGLQAAVDDAQRRMNASKHARDQATINAAITQANEDLKVYTTSEISFMASSSITAAKSFAPMQENSKEVLLSEIATAGNPPIRIVTFDHHEHLDIHFKTGGNSYQLYHSNLQIQGNPAYIKAVYKPHAQWEVNRLQNLINQLTTEAGMRSNWLSAKKDYDEALAALQRAQAEIEALWSFLNSEQAEMPAHLVQIDNQGLTCSGALLGFAWTASRPQLFVSSEGKVSLYFQGSSDQFFAAFFQTLGERNVYQLHAGDDSALRLLARSTESEFDQSRVRVEDAGAAERCHLTITNDAIGLVETWKEIPRDIQFASEILNGEASVSTYDYAAYASTNQLHNLKNGSMLFNASARGRGLLLNGVAVDRGRTRNATWTAQSPGRAIQNKGGLALGESHTTFQRKADFTMESWVKLHGGTGTQNLLLNNLGNQADYRIDVEYVSTNNSVVFSGSNSGVVVSGGELHALAGDMTIEFWVKPERLEGTLWKKAVSGEGSLTFHPDGSGRLQFSYGNAGDNQSPDRTESFVSKEVLNAEEWNHVALTRQTKTVNGVQTPVHVLYINTKKDSVKASTIGAIVGGHANLEFGRGDTNRTGTIEFEEIRIWGIARSGREIKQHHNQNIKPHQASLLWLLKGARDHMTNTTIRGTQPLSIGGQLGTGSIPVALKPMRVYAQIGESSLMFKEQLYQNQWYHIAAAYNQSFGLRFKSEDYLDCGNAETLNLVEELTLEAFLDIDLPNTFHSIFSKGEFSDAESGTLPYELYINLAGQIVFSYVTEEGEHIQVESKRSIGQGFRRIAVVRARGTDQTEEKTTQVIEGQSVPVVSAVDIKTWTEIRIYIDEKLDRRYRPHSSLLPKGNDAPLKIGAGLLPSGAPMHFNGKLAEVRIWNRALNAEEVGLRHLNGREQGLVSHWRLEENQGNRAFDARGRNNGIIKGAKWIESPDPKGSTFELYLNGERAEAQNSYLRATDAVQRFELGGMYGELEELRIWDVARTEEEIRDNLFGRLKGEKHKLIAYYTMDGDFRNGVLRDNGLRGNDLTASDLEKLTQIPSTAPISMETSMIRSALSGFGTTFNQPIGGSPGAAEYADIQTSSVGTMQGVLKRCYCYIQDGTWNLIKDYKVGNLYQEWIGQAQYDPQVMGFVEGAPPVPGENLTEGPKSSSSTYQNASKVVITEAEEYAYSVSASSERGFGNSFELSGYLGVAKDLKILQIAAPLGVGIGVEEVIAGSVKMGANLKGSMDTSNTWTDGEAAGNGRSTTTEQKVSLNGQWENKDYSKNGPTDSSLTRRYIPTNMGFAFVQSQTADIFALRLVHNNALVMMRMLPNPDIPRDWNIIPFPINPHYTKQGTLDGRVGFNNDGSVNYDEAYPAEISSDYGEYSYFKPREAYALKKRIQRKEKDIEEYYRNFDTTPTGVSALEGLVNAASSVIEGDLGSAFSSATSGVTDIVDGITGNVDVATRFAKRNLVNTYVWTAEGGLFSEETSLSEMKQESQSGSYNLKGEISLGVHVDIDFLGLVAKREMSAGLGAHLNITKNKSATSSTAFGFSVDLNLPGDIQLYEYNADAGKPLPKQKPAPGKVDAYRFMTFYLEPEKRNFEDLFNKVIDPQWLESNDQNALAMKQANQATRKPPCWRVMHRVTFVSRILPEFQSVTAPPLLRKMKEIDLASNYQLITRLDSLVRGSKTDFGDLAGAIDRALQKYMPELRPFQTQILELMAAYYGLEV